MPIPAAAPPCKTFVGAISKTAAAGEINTLDPGGFGAVTITRSIRLDGSPSGTAGILASGSNGIIINAGATDAVILRNLAINGNNAAGTLRGIRVMGAKQVFIENCEIWNWGQRAISIENANADVQVFINDSIIHSNASNGIFVQPASPFKASVTLSNVQTAHHVNFGLLVFERSTVMFNGGSLSNNSMAGARVDAFFGPSALHLDHVAVSGNATGLLAVNGGVVRIADTTIFGNTVGIDGIVTSYGNNRIYLNGSGNAPSGTTPLQ